MDPMWNRTYGYEDRLVKFQSNNVANNVKIDDWLLPESIICEAKVSAIRVNSWLTVAI